VTTHVHHINSPLVLAAYEVGDIVDRDGQHPARIVSIDLAARTVTVRPLGWLGRLWLRVMGGA
jgi:hypothetical protein